MQEGGRKVEATSSTRYHNTLWVKIGLDRPSKTLTDAYIRFCRKPNLNSIQWLGHPIAIHLFVHYQNTPCLITLVGSLRYPITLLKYRLFYWIVELYPTLLHCWAILNPNTMFRYNQFNYIVEVNPKSLHDRAVSNPNTLLRYNQLWYIAELCPILLHSRAMVDLNKLPSAFAKRCRCPVRIEYYVNQ